MSLDTDLEKSFVDYLTKTLTTTYGYPVYQGISDGQKAVPSLTFVVEGIEEFPPSSGIYNADCNVIILTQVRTGSNAGQSALINHKLLSEDVRKVMRDVPTARSFINSPTSSCYVYDVIPHIINKDTIENVLVNAGNYTVVTQIGYASGSINYFQG